MSEPMNPADVPQNLVDAATFAFAARSVASSDIDFTAYVRTMLAAALPIHAEQLGAKLGRLTVPCPHHRAPREFNPECVPCHRYSALIGARRLIEGRDTAAEAVRQLRADVTVVPTGCARCGDPHHRLDDCPDYDPDDDYHGSYE